MHRAVKGRGRGWSMKKKKGDRFQPHPRGMFATPADEKRSPCLHRIYIEIELLIFAGATDCADPTCQFYGFNELQTPKCIAAISFGLWSGVGVAGMLPKLFQKRHIKDIFINMTLKYVRVFLYGVFCSLWKNKSEM